MPLHNASRASAKMDSDAPGTTVPFPLAKRFGNSQPRPQATSSDRIGREAYLALATERRLWADSGPSATAMQWQECANSSRSSTTTHCLFLRMKLWLNRNLRSRAPSSIWGCRDSARRLNQEPAEVRKSAHNPSATGDRCRVDRGFDHDFILGSHLASECGQSVPGSLVAAPSSGPPLNSNIVSRKPGAVHSTLDVIMAAVRCRHQRRSQAGQSQNSLKWFPRTNYH